MNLYLWGCGERCKHFMENGYIQSEDVKGFIDKNTAIETFYGRKVYRPQEIAAIADAADYILVTTKEEHINRQILAEMRMLAYPMDKVLFAYNYFPEIKHERVHEQNDEQIKDISERLYKDVTGRRDCEAGKFYASYKCEYHGKDDVSVLETDLFFEERYRTDYTRYRTFELAADEIERNHVPGAAAELGVFKGTFSKLINARFPDRKLFLYDSFESFQEKEYANERAVEEIRQVRDEFREIFTNTSADKVLKLMPYAQNCVIRKGYFPGSIQEQEKSEIFAFVSLDVDLEQPTYAGLEFFYPRLAQGGYIFLHDYNNSSWDGVKKAVIQYENDHNVHFKKVPICDQSGTLVIVK